MKENFFLHAETVVQTAIGYGKLAVLLVSDAIVNSKRLLVYRLMEALPRKEDRAANLTKLLKTDLFW